MELTPSTQAGAIRKDARKALSPLDPEQNVAPKAVIRNVTERICVWNCDNCGRQGGMSVEIEDCPDCEHPRCENCRTEWHHILNDEQPESVAKDKSSTLPIRGGINPAFTRARSTASDYIVPLQSTVTYVCIYLFRDAQH
jgi:hypothetical protein